VPALPLNARELKPIMNQEFARGGGAEITLGDTIITEQLVARTPRARDELNEAAAMERITETMASDPSKMFEVCAEVGLSLCRADSCGISLRERTEAGEDIFRWVALAGDLKKHLHGTTPRHFSPCGICVDSATPVLMKRPELFYRYLDVGPPFEDVLLVPLLAMGQQIEATIWVIAHTPDRKFDLQDAYLMERLTAFIAMALRWRMSRMK
jgi:hypothetical protein